MDFDAIVSKPLTRITFEEWRLVERNAVLHNKLFVRVLGRLARRCKVVRRCGVQCRKAAVAGRTRCRSHGGGAQKPQTPQGRYARELVLDGLAASAIVAATGLSERHVFTLKAQHRAGRMRLEVDRPRRQARRESRAVTRERGRVQRQLAQAGIFPVDDDADFSWPR
jgi:hypothetical protein